MRHCCIYIFVQPQETVRDLVFFLDLRSPWCHLVHTVLVPFGNILPKSGLVGCVSRSDNFFYLFLSSFKGSNFGCEYQEEVIIKAEQNKTPITVKRGRLRRQRHG